MKKLIFTLLAVASTLQSEAQEFVINHCVDAITKREYFMPTENIYVVNEKKDKAFLLTFSFKKKADKIVLVDITCKSVVGSSCVEKSSLYFVLENDEVITLSAWNKFNCDSKSYFGINDKQLELLSIHSLKAIRFTNGRDYSQLTGFEKGKENLFKRLINNYVVKEISCDN